MYMIITHAIIFGFFSAGLLFIYKYYRELRSEGSELHDRVTKDHQNIYIFLKYALPILIFFFIFALMNSGAQIILILLR